jgi:hypothetical protein
MTTTPQATPGDIVGSWRAAETEGVELGYYFYPDGVLILRNPHQKKFALRGAWTLEGDRLVISDIVDPHAIRPEEEQELIRAERHTMAILEMSRDSMVCQPEEAPAKVAFHREGELPERERKAFWKRLLGV